jgi:hypothetical protein
MTGEIVNRQILALSLDGLSAEGIASDLCVPLEQVKLVLSAHKAGSDLDRDINDEQLANLRRNAYNLAIQAEDEAVQARMTMYLLDRDKPKAQTDHRSGITAINNAIIIAKQEYDSLMADYAKGQ